MSRQALVVLFLAAGVLAPLAPARAAQPFDGSWSVEVITEKGTCDRAYRWDLTVTDGRVLTTPDMPAKASGSISPKGAIAVSFSRGSDTMTAQGSASGKFASGNWTSPSLACSGKFRAEKRA